MKQGPSFLATFLCSLIWLSGCSSPDSHTQRGQETIAKRQATSPIETKDFIDSLLVDRATKRAQAESLSGRPCSYYVGGVVNHHVLASDILAQFFVELGRCRPDLKTVIFLSPDHYQAGQAPFVTHMNPYLVGLDEVTAASSSITRLMAAAPFGRLDPRPFVREHGIGALVPFLHRVLPEVTVGAVAIDGRITEEKVRYLVDWLRAEIRDPHTVVIVSSDMSHYLPKEQASTHDRQTLEAFDQQDANFFFRVSDDYTDNGKGIWAAVQALHPDRWSLQSHKASWDYGGSTLNTTTYITGFWSDF